MNQSISFIHLLTLLSHLSIPSLWASIDQCPDNSICTEKSKALFETYTNELAKLTKKESISKLSVPNFGYKNLEKIVQEELYWKDCPGNSSVKVMFFSDNLLVPDMIHKPFYEIKDNMVLDKTTPYYIPFTESPLFIFQDRIYFIKQIKNNYYYASVGNQGEFSISDKISSKLREKYLKIKSTFTGSVHKCHIPDNLKFNKAQMSFPKQEFTPHCMFVANLNKNKFEKYLTLRRQCLRN